MMVGAAEVIAVLSLAVAAAVAIVNVAKYWAERKQRLNDATSTAIQAVAERDATIVETATNTLRLLERTLAITKASEEDLRTRVRTLEERLLAYDEKFRQQQSELATSRRQMRYLQSILERQGITYEIES